MGKYIGQETAYGVFEKQLIDTASSGPYELMYRVVDTSSIIVVCDRILLEPDSDYELAQVGIATQLVLNVDLSDLDGNPNNDTRLYVIYLGKTVSVPVPISTPTSMNSLSDVSISVATQGQGLIYDGTKWVNAAINPVAIQQRLDAAESKNTELENRIAALEAALSALVQN